MGVDGVLSRGEEDEGEENGPTRGKHHPAFRFASHGATCLTTPSLFDGAGRHR